MNLFPQSRHSCVGGDEVAAVAVAVAVVVAAAAVIVAAATTVVLASTIMTSDNISAKSVTEKGDSVKKKSRLDPFRTTIP